MAYSPFDEGRLLHHRALVAFAKQHAMTPSQAALAWLLAQDGVIVIPKTGQRERARENAAALEHRLTAAHLRELDALFLPPRGPSPLGKRVTRFTNSEEGAVGLTKVVPFLVEDMLKERGGLYSKVNDWQPFALSDANLITGQNPASSRPAATALLDQLRQRGVA